MTRRIPTLVSPLLLSHDRSIFSADGIPVRAHEVVGSTSGSGPSTPGPDQNPNLVCTCGLKVATPPYSQNLKYFFRVGELVRLAWMRFSSLSPPTRRQRLHRSRRRQVHPHPSPTDTESLFRVPSTTSTVSIASRPSYKVSFLPFVHWSLIDFRPDDTQGSLTTHSRENRFSLFGARTVTHPSTGSSRMTLFVMLSRKHSSVTGLRNDTSTRCLKYVEL